MRRQRWIRNLFAAGTVVLLLTGCQSNNAMSDAETEALRQQIAQLEQQVSALEQQAADRQDNSAPDETLVTTQEQTFSAENGSTDTQPQMGPAAESGEQSQNDTGAEGVQQPSGNTDAGVQQPSGNTDTVDVQQSRNDVNAEGAQQPQNNTDPQNEEVKNNTSFGSLTTYTMEELSSMVDAYVAKANAAVPGGTAAEIMEQFFALKQEAEQIDNTLDRHEDELEMLYRKQTLAREEYNRLERELDRLEDKLDDAEDYLEFVFGIDD